MSPILKLLNVTFLLILSKDFGLVDVKNYKNQSSQEAN